jgi:hypothetical protein
MSWTQDGTVTPILPVPSLARISPVEDKPWRMREFALADPDNNLIRIGSAR